MGLWIVWIWAIHNPALFLEFNPAEPLCALWIRTEALMRITGIGTLAACVAASRTYKVTHFRRQALGVGVAVSTIGTLGLELLLENVSAGLDILIYLHGAILGIATMVLFLGWATAYAELPDHMLTQTSSLALALSAVLGCAVASLGPQLPVACLAVLPLLSYAPLWHIDDNTAGTDIDPVVSRFPWQFIVLLGCASFACGFNHSALTAPGHDGIILWIPSLLYGITGCMALPVLVFASQQHGLSPIIVFGTAQGVSELMRLVGICSKLLLLALSISSPIFQQAIPIVIGAITAACTVFALAEFESKKSAANKDEEPFVPLELTATATAYRPHPNLTQRELEVVAALANGLTYQEISEELTVTISTVKTHVHHVYRKLGVANRSDAVSLVIEGKRPCGPEKESASRPAHKADRRPDDPQVH